ncbi:DUF423 domain-containing protein [Aeoliella mucimassa]|uniref:DUF423 domain-containing protein n=1 Tax=Aeoliella mucimassa TaxID=2527972 RepID=A0A518ATP7_9BACT|nr:DUF423 domain-containing protein [Aeoliella mucimassa]QDU58098.1 hypothetical protein Pan181_43240 [Aeoliella mucimassa]
MSDLSRRWLTVAAGIGALAVVLGAFGAHGVPSYLEQQGFSADAVAKRLADFQTAARYHMFGALFLMGVSIAYGQLTSTARVVACWTMIAGLVLFCGAVYAVALVPDELRGTFGAIAPFGGTLMIAGWVALGVAARPR